MLHELAMTDVNGEATTLAVGEYIRESIDQAEKTLLDYKGRRSVAEKWVDFVDNSKWLSSFLIDAKHVSPPCEVPGLIFIISAVLRGFGQVVFQDNPWTGLFVCIAGGLPHWPTAIMGIIGCTITTVFPLLVQPLEPRGLVASGIYGFNGVLLGWGYSTFDNNIQRAHSLSSGVIALLRALPAMLFLAILTAILHVVISRSFTRATRIPPLTWPYNIALLMWMACATLSNNYDTLFTHAVTPKALAGEYSITWFFTTWLKGISQVVFSADLWSGVVLLVGILVGSPYSVFLTAYGALVGLLTGMGIGLDFPGMLNSGLVCYNPVLVALSLGGFYVAPSVKGFLVMTFGCILSVVSYQGVVNFLVLPNGGPALTAPFCITVTILLGAMIWDFVDGIPVLFPRQLSCIERHWAVKARTRRAIRVVCELESGGSTLAWDIVRELGRAVSMKVREMIPYDVSEQEFNIDGYAEILLGKSGLHQWNHPMLACGDGRRGESIEKIAGVVEYAAKYELLRRVFLRCCEFGSEQSLVDSTVEVVTDGHAFPASVKEQAVLSARRVSGPQAATEIGIIFGGRDFDNKPLEGIISDCATMAVHDSI